SFAISIVYVCLHEVDIFSQITSISCSYLKNLTVTICLNIVNYQESLLLAIGITITTLDHVVDGFDLKTDIVSYVANLRQFNFHIRSILENASQIEIDTIRQSFVKLQQEPIDCSIEYFNNTYGQGQIYSLPFIGNRLDFISNRFPLFDINNTFSIVTILLLL
ncbi:unnamed protein product, partial [Rotaria magnacalcarata]